MANPPTENDGPLPTIRRDAVCYEERQLTIRDWTAAKKAPGADYFT
jgi:hypothetical protein